MPKSAVISENPTEGAVVHAAMNGIDETLLKDYVEAIEEEDARIEDIMSKARAACQPHVDQIKEIKKDAAENGIPKAPLSAKLRERSLIRKSASCREKLNEDQQSIFDEITLKLGELPLFQSLNG